MAKAASPTAPKRPRDTRLDFFRGLTMFIIFVAHVPDNSWNDWIPARFGFSAGSELFVFCSGVASALAFGRIFTTRGWFLGTARIAYRIWQVYWAHIGLFIASLVLAVAADRLIVGSDFVMDQFAYFNAKPADALLGALTLRWLPPYLDILPLYVAIMALIPVMMAARRLDARLPFVISIGLYVLVWTQGINLTGDPQSGGGWFFNPFAWQLVFFTGFGFAMGWIPRPAYNNRPLMGLSALIVVGSIPVAFWGIRAYVPALEHIYAAILPGNEKTDLHILRYVHFLALAYLVLSLVDPIRERLSTGPGRVIIMVGQQSLAAFLGSLIMARLASVLLETMGRGALDIAIANIAGFLGIIVISALTRWIKSAPWSPVATKPAPAPVATAVNATLTPQADSRDTTPPHGHAFVIAFEGR